MNYFRNTLVGDDCALLDGKDNVMQQENRRGIAGTVLLHKILGFYR